ncbi:carbon-nitrogen hydrolase family protein [Elioraea rosea]|uniref:carbon-nitrogen hydrolase family protein n=1 Tax=Elioraea rosea TaxID=2492390 RepID=UPI0011839EEE|nr:nitrilase-related carbon-nitrogen hydrolase [Elioraea rosea]
MRVAAVQMTSGSDVAENVSRACLEIATAATEHGAELVVLPEFFNTLYFAQYQDKAHFALAEPEDGHALTKVRETARRNNVAVIATIYEMAGPGLYFDTAFHIDPAGEIIFRYRKVHPAAVLSLEKLYFRYGARFDTYRMGDWRIGIGICYDMAFPETARSLAVNGAELLVAPYATSRTSMFQEVLRTRAFENGCCLIAANKVGREGGWTFGGHSLISDPTGKVLASADGEAETIIAADISRDSVIRARIDFPSRRDRRPELYGAITADVPGA